MRTLRLFLGFILFAISFSVSAQQTTREKTIAVATGAPGACVNLDTHLGTDTAGSLTGGVTYRVVNTSGVYAFCKLGSAATVEVDVPYPPDLLDYTTAGNTGTGTLTMHCIQRSATTVGKVQFCPMTAKQ